MANDDRPDRMQGFYARGRVSDRKEETKPSERQSKPRRFKAHGSFIRQLFG
jgi:hypothetical protein